MTQKPHSQQGFLDGGVAGALIGIVILAFCVGGYIANICGVVHLLGGPVTTMFIARCIGVFVVPLGVVLGFL